MPAPPLVGSYSTDSTDRENSQADALRDPWRRTLPPIVATASLPADVQDLPASPRPTDREARRGASGARQCAGGSAAGLPGRPREFRETALPRSAKDR